MGELTKKLMTLCLVGCLLLSVGCWPLKDTDQLLIQVGVMTGELTTAYNYIALDILSNKDFSEEELIRLESIDNKAKDLIVKFDMLKYGKELSDTELYDLYKQAKSLYLEARLIIVNNYTIDNRVLAEFDVKATALDIRVTQVNDAYSSNIEIVESIQGFLLTIFKTLLPVLLA